MNNCTALIPLVLAFCLALFHNTSQACSMYKLTVDGKTMVGCNEDAWRTTSRIWFENARNNKEVGAVFTGSRMTTPNKFAPQSGMNEAGLVFSRLASYHPRKEQPSHKNPIKNEVTYLSNILHQCKTIADVKSFIEGYDHSIFIDDVFIYIDSTGSYVIVEPYELIEGNNPNYVLSNFCPSITAGKQARNLERYRNGEDFLSTHTAEASLAFCTAVSDTMHVCRKRNGDGTLLTTIWDSQNGVVNLYFYHNFESTVQFNLANELAKGDYQLDVASLFPANAEFERLANYTTPFNTPWLRVALVCLGAFLTGLSLLFFRFYLKYRNTASHVKSLLFCSIINVLLTAYLFVLATNINIYYFDAPYQHYSNSLISISSYIPLLMLFCIIPITLFTVRFFQHNSLKIWVKALLVINHLLYALCIFGFAYWGLFNVFN